MARNVAIGLQDFGKIISNQCFYVDKTDFIREWWESRDDVTLITRPRRFGKTLNMSMLVQFFSVHDPEEEKTLQDTVQEAHRQIQNRQYEARLLTRGILQERIRCYGFAFQGKKVLIG